MKKLILFLLTIFIHISYCAQQNEPTGSKIKPELDIEKSRAQKRQKTEQDQMDLGNLFIELLIIPTDDQLSIDLQIEKIKDKIKESRFDLNESLSPNMLEFPGQFHSSTNRVPLNFIADKKRFNELAKWLIINGADSTKRDFSCAPRNSPFLTAALHGNRDLVDFMISQGADISRPSLMMNLVDIEKYKLELDHRTIIAQKLKLDLDRDILKQILINGANFKEESFQNYLKANNNIKQAFDEVVQEIVKEYRKKLNLRIKNIIAATGLLLPDLAGIVAEYANYSDEQIMDNIMQIRYELGELSEIQKAKFERAQQQARPAAAAAAASSDIVAMQH